MRTVILGMMVCAFVLVPAAFSGAADWAVDGDWSESCCCAISCACTYGAPATRGYCEGSALIEIDKGHFGDVNLDGVDAVISFRMGAWSRIYVDDSASDKQVDAIVALIKQPDAWGMMSGPDPKILSIEKADISIERTDSGVSFSVPDSRVELAAMPGRDGTPISVENSGIPWLKNAALQHKAVVTSHKRGDSSFSYADTNGFTSKLNLSGNSASND